MSITSEEKRAALEEVLRTPTFVRAGQLQAFLRLICEREITGRAAEINEYLIGVEVLGRPSGYSPSEDSVVRRRAVDLREKLTEIYTGELAAANVRIELPKGRYVPRFVKAEPAATPAAAGPTPAAGRRSFWLAVSAAFVAGVAVTSAAFLAWMARADARREAEAGTTYEAEAPENTLSGTVVREPCETCSGGHRVRRIGNNAANALVVHDLRVPAPGRYTVVVHYLLSGDRTIFVAVNDAPGLEMRLSGTSWFKPASASITVPLLGGTNTLRFYNDAAYAPDLDRVVVRPAP